MDRNSFIQTLYEGRRFVGYLKYDTEEELRLLNELYGYLRLYTNFFQPVMKLIEKTRLGRRVIKNMTPPEHLLTPLHTTLEFLIAL